MFVMKSYFNCNENTKEIINSLLDDESFHVVARTRDDNRTMIIFTHHTQQSQSTIQWHPLVEGEVGE
jgi:hypothetical protein